MFSYVSTRFVYYIEGHIIWMFSNTANGAQASAILYSLVETAKVNGLVPFDYLHHLLRELPGKPVHIDQLLPWNIDLTQHNEH